MFFTISSNDIKFMKKKKKKKLNSFYNENSLLYVFEETKLNFVQICCFDS